MNEAVASILETIEKSEIKFIDFRFTSLTGRLLHVAYHVDNVDHKTFLNGITLDRACTGGQSILKPDLSSKASIFFDPFAAQPTLCLICDLLDADGKDLINSRSIARKAEEYLKKSGIAISLGLDAEFFIFDDARFAVKKNGAFFELDSNEGIYNSGRAYEYNNHGHRYNEGDCRLSLQPNDGLNDIRAEILQTLKEVNVQPTFHYHEAGSSQCRVCFQHGNILEVCDNFQKCKYVVHNVASSYGKSATFMPKPMKDNNGNSMSVHQSLSDSKNTLLYYIGGIIKHSRALCAFTNPTTNSYKRLASCLNGPFNNSNGKLELRFPDPSANPYLAASAILMAGIDGIKDKIHPDEITDELKYKLPRSLDEAVEALKIDREFLAEVFSEKQIDNHIESLRKDCEEHSGHPLPIEFLKYYNL